MKYFEKKESNEPQSLKDTRDTKGADFNSCNKKDLREAVLDEQGFICAYCMQRIEQSHKSTGIEHYDAQANNRQKTMDFTNMLGVCKVSEGKPKKIQHCDKSRGNKLLTVNPMNQSCERLIKYRSSGTIFSENKIINNDLNIILNLNTERLVFNRKYTIETVRQSINRKYKNKKNKTWSKSELQKELAIWQSRKDNQFSPYCQAAIYYLEQKIARL